MIKIRKLLLLSCMLTVVVFTPSISFASCAEFSIEDAIHNDAAIFSGKVLTIQPKAAKEKGRYFDLVLFEVDSIWKGLEETQVILKNESQFDQVESSVDQHFVIGESYLVYAYKKDSFLQTNPCKGTKFLSLASEDLSFLGEGRTPTEPVDLQFFGMKLHHFKHKVYVTLTIALMAGVVLVSCYLFYRVWTRKRK
jgi:hypothetical protein